MVHVHKNWDKHLNQEAKWIENSKAEEELYKNQNNYEKLQALNFIRLRIEYKAKDKVWRKYQVNHTVEYVPERR